MCVRGTYVEVDEAPMTPQDDVPTLQPDKAQRKNKGERSWKRAWKKLGTKVSKASKKSNDEVHTACFIDLGMDNIDSLLSLNLPGGSSFATIATSGKTFSFAPP